MQISNSKYQIANMESKPLKDRVKFLGDCYVKGAKAYDEDEKARKEIVDLNKKIYEQDPEIREIYRKGREWSLEYFEQIYKVLGTKFKFYYFESDSGKEGVKIVKDYLNPPAGGGIFKKSEGAIIFPGERYGLHNRVFINSQGLPTYEAKDLGLAHIKYKDYAFDQSIIITGSEVNEYFKVVLKALEILNPRLAQKTYHISHGMVRVGEGKISSRLGNTLSYEWLLDKVKGKIKEKFSAKGGPASGWKDMDEKVLEQVSLGAIKYGFLKSRIGADLDFDIEKSISLEGDSGPYLQYTYVRTASVLGKSSRRQFGQTSNVKRKPYRQPNLNPKLKPEELSVLRCLVHFPEIVEQSANSFSPNTVCSYLFNLAQKFNLFYQKQRIIGSSNEEFRLKLTQTIGSVIKNGLYLLGIESPHKM